MKKCPVAKCLISTLVCIGLNESVGVLLYAQSLQAKQMAQALPPPVTAQVVGQKPPVPLNYLGYEWFFEWVASENKIRPHRLGLDPIGQAQAAGGKIDYSSAIGIDSDKGQAMIDLILDAEQRCVQNDKKFEQTQQEFIRAQQQGTTENLGLTRPNRQAELNENWAIFMDAWSQIKQMLGEEDFAKLDAFVDREFKTTRYPASFFKPKPEPTIPVPVNFKYELFFDEVIMEDQRVQRAIQESDAMQAQRWDYSLAAGFPGSKEETVLAIARETHKSIEDYNDQISAVTGQFIRKYGPAYHLTKPYPPDIQAWDDRIRELARERDNEIDRAKERLKDELGEDYFKKFDSWIQKHYGTTGVLKALPPSTEPASPPSTTSPTASQVPGVRP